VNPLIGVSELAVALASAQPPLLLDVRFPPASPGRAAYQEKHVPGAAFLDRDEVLAGPPGTEPGERGGRHPLPDPAALEEALRDLGVSEDHPLVVYDEGRPPSGSAARAWWILRWAGHPDVRVLDGGFAAWVEDGRPATADEEVERPRGDFTVRPGSMPVLDAAGAAARAAAGALLDARAPARFRGEVEPLDRVAGRIPGARNLPFTAVTGPHGRFLPPDDVAKLVADLPPGGQPGTYCGSGITAAHTALALTTIGYTPALYVGSWSEWITDSTRPIETGRETGEPS
jgi:thiosulfate/3-mercaptopyruvate sulfurtransferase